MTQIAVYARDVRRRTSGELLKGFSGLMQRGSLLIVVVLVVGTLVACGEHESGIEASDDTADVPTPELAPTEAVADFPDHDPREIAVELTRARLDSNYQLAYDRLVPEFHLLEPGEFWLTRLLDRHILIFEPHGGAIDIEAPVDIDDWEVEEHADFVVVRDRELPINALVLRAEEGKWRWDPGDRGLGQSWHNSLPDDVQQTRGWTLSQIHGAHIDYSIDLPEPEVLFALNAFLPITLVMRDDGPELTLGLSISSGMLRNGTETKRPFDHLAHDTLVDLGGVTWRAKDESGPVEIVWTDARVEDNALVLPGSTKMDHEVPYFDQEYSVTFRLVDFPNDADEAEMVIDEILIGPFGEDVPEYQDEQYPVSVEFSFPIETSADILLGNLPEVEVPDSLEAGEPTPHDELPSNMLDVAFEVQSVEYDQRDDAVHVDLVIDTGGVLPEQPGGEILLTWDDGYTEWTSESDDVPGDAVESAVDAAEPTPTLEPSPTPAIDAGADQDPRDVLIALTQDPEDPDLELVYQYLTERFRVLGFARSWTNWNWTNCA